MYTKSINYYHLVFSVISNNLKFTQIYIKLTKISISIYQYF